MTAPAWPIPRIWERETAVIIATGPSLSLAQIRHVAKARLEGRCRVLAVNDAIFCGWWADWLHACDGKWWRWHIQAIHTFPGIKTTLDESADVSRWAHRLANADGANGEGMQRGGWSDASDAVLSYGNSGGQAMQIAAKAGARSLILLGFDMKPAKVIDPATGKEDWKTHYFGDHSDGIRSDYESTMLRWFPAMVEPLKRLGVEVINCSPDSALTCWPMGTLDQVL